MGFGSNPSSCNETIEIHELKNRAVREVPQIRGEPYSCITVVAPFLASVRLYECCCEYRNHFISFSFPTAAFWLMNFYVDLRSCCCNTTQNEQDS